MWVRGSQICFLLLLRDSYVSTRFACGVIHEYCVSLKVKLVAKTVVSEALAQSYDVFGNGEISEGKMNVKKLLEMPSDEFLSFLDLAFEHQCGDAARAFMSLRTIVEGIVSCRIK